MCLNNLSVYTGDKNIFHDKSSYPFHGEQATKLISFTFDHPVQMSLLHTESNIFQQLSQN